jgi:hypothetical protein
MDRLAQFLKPDVPSEGEKQRAHEEIMKLVQGDLPARLQSNRQSEPDEHITYQMLRDKLLPENVARAGMAQRLRHGDLDDYVSHTYLAYAIRTKSCAGTLKHTITESRRVRKLSEAVGVFERCS